MAQKKVYDQDFKIQTITLGREIGFSKTAKELGAILIPFTSGTNAPKKPD